MQTPDPLLTTEQVAAFATTIITSVVVLFGLDVTDEWKASLVALIGTAWTIFTLVHASQVRKGRALNAQGVNDVKR